MVWCLLPFARGKHDRVPDPCARHDEAVWTEWANNLPPGAFLVWLAGQISDDLLIHRHAAETIGGLIESVEAATGPGQIQAERYLQRRTRWFVMPPQRKRVIGVFRHLIRLNLRWGRDLTH